ncbi:MAG: class B sortase [Oscillospiraceae bacterium]|nr:class B sortase [Oscillospiraceae bacterium]
MKSSQKKKKIRRIKKKLRALLPVFCVVLFLIVCFSGWKVYSIQHAYKTAERRYDSLAGSVVAAAPGESGAAAAASAPSPSDGNETSGQQPQDAAPEREVSPVTIDFDSLRAIGGDVIGWICLPHTAINYPVAQARDNEYYLDRFIDGTTSSGGTLFADCVCPSDFSGKNTIIYGHNMKDGSMFALIDDYADQSFYDQYPVMYINTPTKNYRVDIFSCFTTDPVSYVYRAAFASNDDFAAHLRSLLADSEVSCQTAVAPEDRIVTLSTCTYTGEDVRFVVCGKLTEIG